MIWGRGWVGGDNQRDSFSGMAVSWEERRQGQPALPRKCFIQAIVQLLEETKQEVRALSGILCSPQGSVLPSVTYRAWHMGVGLLRETRTGRALTSLQLQPRSPRNQSWGRDKRKGQ